MTSESRSPQACNCPLRTKLLGDGCAVCNPEHAEDSRRIPTAEILASQVAGWRKEVARLSDLIAHATAGAPAMLEAPTRQREENVRFAIDGAIQYGREGRNMPPTEDHWLMEYWQIGRQLAKLGETSAWDNVTQLAAEKERDGEPVDSNALERLARELPDECFLKGSGVLKLTGAIRQLERELREYRADRAIQNTNAGEPT